MSTFVYIIWGKNGNFRGNFGPPQEEESQNETPWKIFIILANIL